MKRKSILAITLILLLLPAVHIHAQAPQGAGIGDLTNQYTCQIEGYTIRVYRPAHVPSNSNVRQIHVETHAKSFYARWTELSVLLGYPNLVLDYENLGMQNIPPYEYCDRNGYTIVDENAFYVQIQNDKNYTGYTNDLDGVNLDTAERAWLVQVFNQYKVQHHLDELPVGCLEGCLDQGSYEPDDPGEPIRPGGYTLANGAVGTWDFLEDPTSVGSGGPIISVGGATARFREGFNRPSSSGCIGGLTADVYFPLLQLRRTSLGMRAGLAYHDHGGVYCWGSGNTVNAMDVSSPIPVQNGQSEVEFHQGDSFSQAIIQGGLGVQLNFHPGNRLMVSAIAEAGYLNIEQNPYSIIQHVSLRESDHSFMLMAQEKINISSIYYSPGLRLTFKPGRFLHFWTGVAYTFGGSSTYENQVFTPNGGPNDQGNYFLDSILSGEVRSQSVESDNTYLNISAGISIGLRSRR